MWREDRWKPAMKNVMAMNGTSSSLDAPIGAAGLDGRSLQRI